MKFVLTDISDKYLVKLRYFTFIVNIVLSFVQVSMNFNKHNEWLQIIIGYLFCTVHIDTAAEFLSLMLI
jgi:hypothetical protein